MSLNAVHPELRSAAATIPPFAFDLASVAATRDRMNAGLGSHESRDDEAVTVRAATAAGSTGHRVPLLVYEPTGPRRGAMLDIHGGGFLFGNAAMNDAANRRIVRDLGLVVVSVDYRLAPEHPYPAGLDDCRAAARWLIDHGAELGTGDLPLLLLGNSAGGGLAAALCLRLRDDKEQVFDGLILLSPMLDDRTGQGPLPPFAGSVGWNAQANAAGWHALLARSPGGSGVSEYAAPARAASLEAMPPTFLSVGSIDLFCEETCAFARRLMAAGVPTDLHVYRGAFHGFARFAPDANVSRRSAADCHAAMQTMLDEAKNKF